ncbi:MAG: YraN family protein, partial [Oscillospiraceae bacterium]|nr:YraN family protein [Oscillospiraceae bacterium]
MNTKISGAMGEAYVAEYFRKKRYKLLAMNYRCHMGEIDLI